MITQVDNFFPILIQRKIIKLVTRRNFPWYYRPAFDEDKLPEIKNVVKRDNNIILGYGFNHTFFNKNEKNTSSYPFDLLSLFKTYTEKKFNVKINMPLRLQCSFTLPQHIEGIKYMVPHVDWMFPHYTVLYYVNTTEGNTYIFNERAKLNQEKINKKELYNLEETFATKTLLEQIVPKQGNAVMFDGLHYHSGSFPQTSNRYILNFNFI